MAVEQDGSGLTICGAVDQRLTLATVLTMAGGHTTATMTKTFPFNAIAMVILIN